MAWWHPEHEGLLPYFLVYTSVSAAIHTAVCYLRPPTTSLVQFQGPARPPPHGLLARVYGVKNVYTAFIRLYAAYHITNSDLYNLAMCTFGGVLFLYGTEWLVYRTVRRREVAFPAVTASVGLGWMWMQRGFYLHY
ncbi:ergosterol biosynthesis protein-like protein Erg28 [Chaetomium strumarium]|uniref:Ergosterol biosynthesis protein-like protein Erg28 n=1 Tax=Chaetomium strumarium TaxID=1170767 RepID=A0AAJ0M6A5_9PEZI|nr:ergosterol biosynthesis protein-like protein Erg28 [Chaetomium strumarium]